MTELFDWQVEFSGIIRASSHIDAIQLFTSIISNQPLNQTFKITKVKPKQNARVIIIKEPCWMGYGKPKSPMIVKVIDEDGNERICEVEEYGTTS